MKTLTLIISLAVFSNCFSQDSDDYRSTPKTSYETQPYFKVLTKNVNIDRIPLLLTTVDVDINGFMAEVTVTQYYKNDGDIPLEAQYVFPGSTDAAVHEVQMIVGDRKIMAEIQKKAEAKATYIQAKKEGKTTSLLEQSDPGLFTMNLANILPGDDIQVSLSYTEKIIPSQGRYTFNYPAVGRPSVLAKGNTSPQSYTPGQTMGFDLSVHLNSPLPIANIISKHHEVDIEYHSNEAATIFLDSSEQLKFDKDFIFEYDLRDQAVNSGLLLHQGDDEGYFLLTIQPPAEFRSSEIIPREYIFVVDSSGSMSGVPIENAKFITQSLISDLAPEEYFNLVLFAGGSQKFNNNSKQVNQADIKAAMEMVSISSAGGSTDLFGALESINEIPRIDGVSRTLVIMTDGAISVPDRTIDLLTQTAKQNVFVIGVSGGYSNDVATIKSLALAGQGQPFFIQDNEQEIAEIQQQFLDYVRYPLLSNIEVETIGFEGLDIQPTHVVDLFAERPVFIVGKYTGKQRGSIRITGKGNGRIYDQFFDLDGISDQNNESIKYLWAREKINHLTLNQTSNEALITDMGLDYHLMTPFTSFVAVDELVRNDSGVERVTQQPSISGYGFAENSSKLKLKRMALNVPIIPQLDPTPLLIRSKQRQDITFIMGKDKPGDNMFYGLAEDLFHRHPLYKTGLIVHLSDLSEVKSYLEVNHEGEPWGVINVVAHSSPWSGIQQENDSSISKSLNYFNVNTLLSDKSHRPLADNIIDALSEIRLIGCAIGGQKNLLSSLAFYFGGNDIQRPQLKAPNGFVFLKNGTEQPALFALKNPWFFSSHEVTSDDVALLKLIGKNTPDPRYINAKHWKLLPVEISLPVPLLTHVPESALKNLAANHIELVRFLEDLSASVEDFAWHLDTDDKENPQLIGNSVLVKFKVPDGNITHLLDKLDFDDPKMMSSSQ